MFAFSNHKSHIFLHVYINFFHILEFPGIFFHFPKITRKRSGFPGIQEISFKVETLTDTPILYLGDGVIVFQDRLGDAEVLPISVSSDANREGTFHLVCTAERISEVFLNTLGRSPQTK